MNKIEKMIKLLNATSTIKNSAYFDVDWYSRRYHIDKKYCAKHYLKYGYLTDFDPSSLFSSKEYLTKNPDVKMNPLLHYELYGKYEGRLGVDVITHQRTHGSLKLDDEIKKRIDENDIISFDIFDTLLVRPFVKEVDLFYYIENKYNLEGFAFTRINSEKRARKLLNREIGIEEIYEQMPYRFKDTIKIELYEEKNLVMANQQVKGIYDYCLKANKKIICISDMYLSDTFEKEMLKKCGYEIDEVYCSCESTMSKGNGELYKYIKSIYPNKSFLHFGDNDYSDIRMAQKAGFDAIRVYKNYDILLQDEEFDCFREVFNTKNLKYSMIAGISSNNYYNFEKDSNDYKFGYSLGGALALAYLNFICKIAKQNNVDCLLFVARDGYVLKKLYEKYYKKEFGFDSGYVYLTRSCVLSATLDYSNEDRYLHKILKLAKSSGLDIDLNNDIHKEYSDKYQILEKWAHNNRDILIKHLRKEIGDKNKRVMTVDLNTKYFTSLKSCSKLLEDKEIVGMFSVAFGNDSGAAYETFANRIVVPEEMHAGSIMEILLSAPEDNIAGIDENLMPIYEEDDSKNNYQEIMRGILEFVDNYLKVFDRQIVLSFDEWMYLCNTYIDKNNSAKDRLKMHYKNSI